jgi:hypothetical protein
MLRPLFLPFPDFWYVGLVWTALACSAAIFVAHRKNRSKAGWAILCGLTALFFGTLGFAWVALLASRKKVDMRMKYLLLRMEEQIADALRLPSPVRGNLEDRLLMVLANNPQGLRIGALAQGIGQDWRHIHDLVQRLVSQGKIRKEGDLLLFNLD